MNYKELELLPADKVYNNLLNDFIKAKSNSLDELCINNIIQLALLTRERMEWKQDLEEIKTKEDILNEFENEYNKIKTIEN